MLILPPLSPPYPLLSTSVVFARCCHCRLIFHHLLIVVLYLCQPPAKTCIIDVVVRVVAAVVDSLPESPIPLLLHSHCPSLPSPLPPSFVDCCFLCPGGIRRLVSSLASSSLSPSLFVIVVGGNGNNSRWQKLFLPYHHCHCQRCCCCRHCCCRHLLPVAVITLAPVVC